MSKHPLSNCPPSSSSCMSVKYDSGECVFLVLQSQRSSAQFTFHSQHTVTAVAMHYDGNLEVGTWKSAMSMPQLHVHVASLVL